MTQAWIFGFVSHFPLRWIFFFPLVLLVIRRFIRFILTQHTFFHELIVWEKSTRNVKKMFR